MVIYIKYIIAQTPLKLYKLPEVEQWDLHKFLSFDSFRYENFVLGCRSMEFTVFSEQLTGPVAINQNSNHFSTLYLLIYTHATMTLLTLNLVPHETKYLDVCVYGNILIPTNKVGDKVPRTNFGVGHS